MYAPGGNVARPAGPPREGPRCAGKYSLKTAPRVFFAHGIKKGSIWARVQVGKRSATTKIAEKSPQVVQVQNMPAAHFPEVGM